VPQDAEDLAQLLHGRTRGRAQQLNLSGQGRGLACGGEFQCPGVHRDQAQPVAQEVVHLPCDPGPFLQPGRRGGQRPGLFQIGVALPQQVDQGPSPAQHRAGQGGEQQEEYGGDGVLRQLHRQGLPPEQARGDGQSAERGAGHPDDPPRATRRRDTAGGGQHDQRYHRQHPYVGTHQQRKGAQDRGDRPAAPRGDEQRRPQRLQHREDRPVRRYQQQRDQPEGRRQGTHQ
jgi:hypothetical protein